jgi:hypothetical protein
MQKMKRASTRILSETEKFLSVPASQRLRPDFVIWCIVIVSRFMLRNAKSRHSQALKIASAPGAAATQT